MGLGILTVIHPYIPIAFYLAGMLCALCAIFYRVDWPLCFLIAILPFQFTHQKIQEYFLGKDLIDIILVCLVIGWFMRNRTFVMTKSVRCIMAYVTITFLSLLLGAFCHGHAYSFDTVLAAWKNLMIMPLLMLIVLNNVQDKKTMVIILAIIMFATIMVDQRFYAGNRWVSHETFRADQKGGSFGYLNVNHLAAFVAEMTAIAMGLFIIVKKLKFRLLLALPLAASAYPLLFSYSRGAYVAFAGAMVFFCFFRKKLFVLLMLMCFFAGTILPDAVIQRITITKTEVQAVEGSARSRFELWEHAFDLFTSNPILGIGFRSFPSTLPPDAPLKNPHNYFLEVLAEQGIVGFAVFLGLLFLGFRSGLRLYRRTEDLLFKGLGLGFSGCVVVCAIANIFGDRWSFFAVQAYYWVIWAIVESCLAKEDKPATRGEPQPICAPNNVTC